MLAQKGLIQALLAKAKDPINIDESRRPYFRFGASGRGEYHVDLHSTASGKPRNCSVYVLSRIATRADRFLYLYLLRGTAVQAWLWLWCGSCVFSMIDPLQHYRLQHTTWWTCRVPYGGTSVQQGHTNIILVEERNVTFDHDIEVLELHGVMSEQENNYLNRRQAPERSKVAG